MLRKCRVCGIEAHKKSDLDLFKKQKEAKYGRANRCKKCQCVSAMVWHVQNKEKRKEYKEKYYIENKKDLLVKQHNYYQENRHSVDAYKASKRARKKSATPSWYRKEIQRVRILYATAHINGLHVDHIVPLIHDKVCGLHCLANLQLLGPTENIKKSNNFEV